jgi:hypothetical protein
MDDKNGRVLATAARRHATNAKINLSPQVWSPSVPLACHRHVYAALQALPDLLFRAHSGGCMLRGFPHG